MTRRKDEPRRYCHFCGARLERKRINGRLEDLGVFKRRKYCDFVCMGMGQRKGSDDLSRQGHLWRSRQHRKDACERCGTRERLHVHHEDGNWQNADPSNLVTLCATCHLKLHWAEPGGHFESRRWVPREQFERLVAAAEEAIPLLGDSPVADALRSSIAELRNAKK